VAPEDLNMSVNAFSSHVPRRKDWWLKNFLSRRGGSFEPHRKKDRRSRTERWPDARRGDARDDEQAANSTGAMNGKGEALRSVQENPGREGRLAKSAGGHGGCRRAPRKDTPRGAICYETSGG